MFARSSSRRQLDALVAQESGSVNESVEHDSGNELPRIQVESTFSRLLLKYSTTPQELFLLGSALAICLALLLFFAISVSIALAFLLTGLLCYLVYARAQARVVNRQHQYAVDLPTILLAMASNMKIGLPAYSALERATRLFAQENLIRRDTENFLEAVQRGVPASDAISRFASEVKLAEIVLFKKAFLLVIEHGGRFAPTLERLSRIGRERALLAQSLSARTAGMRLTANVLLLTAPALLLMLSSRIDNFWDTLLNHPVASVVAGVGASFIFLGYFMLRRMATLRV